ncbi:DUF368 domain-containing protein [Leuconostoc citreum]
MENQIIKNWISRFVKGIFIALGFILPGVSGGVLASILGLYERMLDFMAHVRQNFKRDFWYFLPVGLGGIVGIILLSNPLSYLLTTYKAVVLWGFAGAIVGTLPTLFKESSKTGRHWSDWLVLFATIIIGGVFLYNVAGLVGQLPVNFFSWLLAGGLIALGVIVPGLSPSNFLLYLGLFKPMIQGFKRADPGVFIPITLGGLVTLLLLSKIMHFLIRQYHAKVYHVILGIVIVSTVLIIVPPVADYSGFNLVSGIASALLFLIGTSIGLWMSQLEEKYK